MSNKSWLERAADGLDQQIRETADNGYVPDVKEMLLALLEGAGELKCVTLKVLLGRALAEMYKLETPDRRVSEAFVKEVEEAIK